MTSGSGLTGKALNATAQLIEGGAKILVWSSAALIVGWSGYQAIMAKLFSPSNATAEVRSLIHTDLQQMTELTTAQITTKATVVVSQDRKLGQWSIGDTNLVYEGVGQVRAGIDLMAIQVKGVDRPQGRIHLLLPPPRIINADLDVQRSSVLANYRNWFGPPVELELQEKAQREALEKIKTEACAGKLLETTNRKAQQVVEHILHTAGYKEIVVETQLPQPGTCPSV
uniref:DUF4230 domain-containing protein n=1 Tax=Cyanothece sp. (strain PCC 7425 / ATCC 29141) TaxID=395961 RepID=B8HYP9_CYAP4